MRKFPYHAGCMLRVCTKEKRDNFRTVKAVCSVSFTRKMCVTIPYRAGCVLEFKNVRDSCLTLQVVCSKFAQERCVCDSVCDSFLTVQAMFSKFT